MINNFAMDMLLCTATLTARRRKIVLWRAIISSLIGAVVATAYAVASVPFRICARAFLAPLMAAVFSKPEGQHKFGDYLGTLAVFTAFTFLAGGAAYGLSHMIGRDINSDLALGAIAFAAMTVILSARVIARRRTRSETTLNAVLTYEGRRLGVNALCDSGNLLQETATGLPVIVLSESVAEKLGASSFDGYIEVDTVSGKDVLPMIKLDQVEVRGRSYCAYGALANRSFGGVDAILQCSMF